jgi:hypothetical protein
MPEAETAISFVQPLAELTVRGHDADTIHLFTLHLTEDAITLVPSAETATDLTAAVGLEDAPPFVRWLGAHMLGADLPSVQRAFKPHLLRDTEVRLAGPYLHVRLGAFDAEYGPGDFDPTAAAEFVAHYRAARRQAE